MLILLDLNAWSALRESEKMRKLQSGFCFAMSKASSIATHSAGYTDALEFILFFFLIFNCGHMHAAPVEGEFRILLPSEKIASAVLSDIYASTTLLTSAQFFSCSPRVISNGTDISLCCTVVGIGYSFLLCEFLSQAFL